MAVINASRFSLRSSLQQPSDQWEAEIPGPAEFALVDPDRVVSLEIGLYDVLNVVQPINVITDGVVDEYRLELQKNSQVSHLKGRDAGARLLDEEFSTIYQRFPGQDITAQVGVTVQIGVFMAQTVAGEVIASAGLTMAWQCRDYELWEDFDATGRKIDILHRLVEPWCSVEPSRVDVFIEGTTVYLRSRSAFPAAADYVLAYDAAGTSPHAKCLDVNIRKTRLPIYGEVSLQGREEPAGTGHDFEPPEEENVVTSNFVEVIPFVRNVDDEGGVTFTPGQLTQRSATRNKDSIVEMYSTYQIPNQVLIETRKNTWGKAGGTGQSASQIANDSVQAGESSEAFAAALPGRVGSASPAEMRLIKTEVKKMTYQEFKYDAKGPTNSPLPLSDQTRISELVSTRLPSGLTGLIFRHAREETTTYSYDEDNYLVTASTSIRRDRDGSLVNDSLVIKDYQDMGPLFFKITTSRYAYQEEEGLEAQDGALFELGGGTPAAPEAGSSLVRVKRFVLVLINTDETISGGHRPGGPNRPPQKPLGADFSGIVALPITVVTTISEDDKAKAAAAGGRHMSAEDLAYIQAQHDEASGLYEAEIEFTVLSMPHIKRGSIIQLTGIEDETDVGIQIAPDFVPGVTGLALVYSLDMDYDEPGRQSLSRVRAYWWEPAP